MASNAVINLNLGGNGTLTGAAPGAFTPPSSVIQFGAGAWPAMGLALTYGAGNNQIKNWFRDQRVIAAGGDDNLDLSGALVNELGDSLLFTAIKLILMAIDQPDGIKKLQVGPRGVANAAQLKWGGVTAVCYEELYNWASIINHPWGGFPITPGTADLFPIHNPGAGAVTYRILIGGLM